MAMVEKPDLIMSTDHGGGLGGGAIWIFLLAFLFLFRGGLGAHEGGHKYADGAGCHDNYKRYDAQFHEIRMENLAMQKTMMQENFQQQLRAQECCCQTQANIVSVRAEVEKQAIETRCQMANLHKETIMAAQAKEIAAMGLRLNNFELIAALRGGAHHPYGAAFGGFIPAPAGYHFHGYSTGQFPPPQNEGCRPCPADRF